MNIDVNYVAVLLASVAFMAIGFAWYSPLLFGKMWMKEKGYSAETLKKAQKAMGTLYGLSFVVSLITAYVLTHIMVLSENFFHYAPVSTGVTTAFSVWLGFVMPTQVTGTIFGNKNWKLFSIDSGYQLAGLVAMGIVIGMMQ